MRNILAAIGFTMASIASAQNSTVLTFAHTEGVQNMQEIATAVRTISDIKEIFVDAGAKTLKLSSGPDQLKLAEWMFGLLDSAGFAGPSMHEFQATGDDPVVHLYFLKTPANTQAFQEVATAIRTVADIRRLFTYNAPMAMIARGNADGIALADWLVSELDQPSSAHTSAVHEYRMAAGFVRDESDIRVFYLTHTATAQEFREVATGVRTIANIRRVFTYSTPRAMVVRSAPDAVALAAWLIDQLDTQNTGQARQASPIYHTYQQLPQGDNATAVQVFFLNRAGSAEDFETAASRVGTTAHIPRVFTYNAPRALVVRGSTDQLKVAEQLVKDIQ
jgi:hypothetical protein